MEQILDIAVPLVARIQNRSAQKTEEEKFWDKPYHSPSKQVKEQLEKMISIPYQQYHPVPLQTTQQQQKYQPPLQTPQQQYQPPLQTQQQQYQPPLQTPQQQYQPPLQTPQQQAGWGYYDQAAYAYDQSLNDLKKTVEQSKVEIISLKAGMVAYQDQMNKQFSSFIEVHNRVMNEMMIILKNGVQQVSLVVERSNKKEHLPTTTEPIVCHTSQQSIRRELASRSQYNNNNNINEVADQLTVTKHELDDE